MALDVALQMSLLLFFAFFGFVAAARLGQSAVVGLVVVGILVGPSWLGLVTFSEFVENLAELGAIVLLFAIGMEHKFEEVITPRFAAIAAAGVAVPWVGGYLTAGAFGMGFAESVLVGTALAATSIAITANVLKEWGLLRAEFAVAIIGAAVVDDVLSLFLLTISEQLAGGDVSAAAIGLLALKAVAFLVAGVVVGLRVLSPLLDRLDRAPFVEAFPETTFIAAMAFAFLYAALAELTGLSAIVGAFIAGTAMEGVRPRRGKSFREGADYLLAIFASIFFVSLGVLVDLRALTWELLVLAIVLSLVGLVTKLAGCGLPAMGLGFSRVESAIIGVGMSPRGEVAMIVALLGLTAGVIGQGVFVSLVVMALLTTVVAPPILKPLVARRAEATPPHAL